MAFLSTVNIIGSGLTAQQLRLDIVSENITNSNTTRVENGEGAYRRKTVVFEAMSGKDNFRAAMARAAAGLAPNKGYETAGGVRVVYDPTHPDANEQGYIELPNVDMVKEIADAMAATQAYSANVTALNALKAVVSKGLEIGK